jgi:hypothetical protein
LRRSVAAFSAKFSGFPNTSMLYPGLAGAPQSQGAFNMTAQQAEVVWKVVRNESG